MTPTADTIVGRDPELRRIDAFLADGGVLLLEGEPGIGKTTVWREAVERAAGSGYRVLACRPAEAEASLSFAGLGDLLELVDGSVVDELPDPQRRALRVALLLDEPTGRPPDQRAVGMALAGVLARLLASERVLLAIDDVQWLDPPSAGAIAFAVRRIDEPPLHLLLARRSGERGDALTASLPRESLSHVELGGLTIGALHHVMAKGLGSAPARPALVRIHEASGGNPLYALELARALADAGSAAPAEPLPVPDSLLALLGRRVEKLAPPAREAALYASAAATPTRALLLRALGRGGTAALDGAERDGVLEERRGRVRFTHPLLASAAYASASPPERRRLHARLAELSGPAEERARHLALAADGPATEVADALAEAAREAAARAAPSTAAELMELCCDLTPPDDPSLEARRLALADLQFSSGDTASAQRIAERLVERLDAGPLRARACEFLAQLLHVAGGARAAAALCEQALAEAGADDELRARIHVTYSFVSYDDFSRAVTHARAACDLLEGLEDADPGLHSQALLSLAGAEHSRTGRVLTAELERAIELERLAPPAHVADRVAAHLGVWLKYSGDFAEARRRLDETYRMAVEEGDDGSLPYALSHYPQLELWTGDWDRATQTALEHLELAEQTGQPAQRAQALFNVGLVAAHRGLVEEARSAVAETLAYAEEHDEAYSVAAALSVLGFLELSLGDAAAAVAALQRDFELLDEIAYVEPRRPAPDYVESLVEVGELARAAEVLDAFEEAARSFGRDALLAQAGRCRALLLAAEGDLDAAVAAAEAALRLHDDAPMPFEIGRTELVLGMLRRRRKEKRLARESLERALAIFEELGAPLWAARARGELARTGTRRTADDELTETELRIAELAASGLTNREIAQAAFVSAKTVEANLSRAYRKLGIRSRAELGAWLAARQT